MKRGFRIYSDQNESLGFVESQEPLLPKDILLRFEKNAGEFFFRDGTERIVRDDELVQCGSVLILCAHARASGEDAKVNAQPSCVWVRLEGSTARIQLRPSLETCKQVQKHLVETFQLKPTGAIQGVGANEKLQAGKSYKWVE